MKNVIYRSLCYLKYKKVKTIMFLLLFIITTFIVIFSGVVKSTINNYTSSIDNKNGIAISIRSNGMRKGFEFNTDSSQNTITTTQINEIKKLSYVSDITTSTDLTVSSSSLTALTISDDSSTSSSDDSSSSASSSSDSSAPSKDKNFASMNGLRITASSNLSLNDTVSTLTMSSGTLPTKSDEVMISKDLADANSKKLNDTFTVKVNGITKTVKIVGIYDYDSDQSEYQMRMLPQNTIYSTYDLASAFNASTRNEYTYYIKSLDDLSKFKAAYLKITGASSDSVSFTVNDSTYQQTIVPLQQINSALGVFKVVAISITSVIILIVLVITIRERSYEIGVLKALSERKSNIIMQLIFETILILVCAFILALLVNFVIDNSLINHLLNNSIFNTINEGANKMGGRGMISGMPGVNSSDISTTAISVKVVYSIGTILLNLLSIVVIIVLIIAIVAALMLRKSSRAIIKE
ncbi:MAG: hypothetical protein LBR40_05285 [Bacilli bacterium]|nr:hypothetical protein [Bacilli bacterium]